MNAALISDFNSSSDFATSPKLASNYVRRRQREASELSEQGLYELPYVKVRYLVGSGDYVVGDVVCDDYCCALAYILAKWW